MSSQRVSLKHCGTDGTVKMARLPVPSAKKLGKSCWRGNDAAVASFRSCWRFCASSSLRYASLTLRDLVHQTADKNYCVLPHKNFISSVSFNALHYVCPTYYFHCLSACPICWTLVGQADGPFSLRSIFLWPVCHVLKGQKTDLFHCPIYLFQTGQADWPFSLSRHVLVRPISTIWSASVLKRTLS